jgi:hypothetical protein
VATLVCLVIVMALLGHMLVGALRIGRQMHAERDRRQCDLLLQAGLDRCARRMAADEPYLGEVWDVPAAEIGGSAAGQVTIRVASRDEGPPQTHVLAEYPLGSESSIRRSSTFQLQSNPLPQE